MVRALKPCPRPFDDEEEMAPTSPLRPIARRALATQSDERLVRLMRDGHEPAFEEIVRRYRGPLVAFAAAIVSADGAEDVVQSSLEKAHRALRADSREIALRPWLFAIVRNGALNAIRREPRVDELGEAMALAAGPSELAEQREDLDRLVIAMCALPEAQRQALVKRELEGVGHGEIAAQLGTTATAVRGLIFRARTGLRDAVGALVPLPVLRALLTEGAAVGVAGGGASVALLGGAGTKAGTAVAVAIVALGTGLAIEQGKRNDPDGGPSVAQASQSQESSRDSGSATTASATDSSTSTAADPVSAGSGESGGDDGSSAPGDGVSGGGSTGSALTAGSGSDSSGDDGDEAPDDDSSGPGSGDDGGGDHGGDDGGSSGPGGGHESGTQPPPPDDDDSGHGSGGHGGGSVPPPPPPPDDDDDSGSGSSGSGGHGGEVEPLEPPEPPEDDSSGSGEHSGPGGGD